ncbi:hypothetical protein A0H76_3041 [Hepatospora eriocheir]|uniref:Uncharacterized protein n=1 Tax=Hepatospora eriocheir TaxID=1081669 RepID=A0A1X0QGB8_9MICR|nr:hypothetical protein A0H76_3041 [Hepatospora eriocheir]
MLSLFKSLFTLVKFMPNLYLLLIKSTNLGSSFLLQVSSINLVQNNFAQ